LSKGCSWRIDTPAIPTQQADVSKDVVALCTELQIALATLRDDLASSKQDSAVQLQSALTTLRTEMKSTQDTAAHPSLVKLQKDVDGIKQDATAQVQSTLTTLRDDLNTTVNTAIHNALATLRAELKADIMREVQSLRSEPASTHTEEPLAYSFQGNMVMTLDDLLINEPVMMETGSAMEAGGAMGKFLSFHSCE
jgi:DNA anti-recombination protein RmuC